jgi:hypothetical protein
VTNFSKYLAALLAVLVQLSARAAETLKDLRNWTPPGLIPGEAGVVVVTYCHPKLGAPTTTAPTANQAQEMPELAAQVFFADAADVLAVIVHNWGLPASFPTWLWPQVFVAKSLGGASDTSFATNFTFGLTNTNSVAMNKLSVGVGSGGTYNVYLRRPHSIGQ